MVFWFAGGGEAASADDEQGSGGPNESSAGQCVGSHEWWRVLFLFSFFPWGEDDDRRCGADLTYMRVQIERLWFDRPKRSAGAPAQSTTLI